MPDKLVDNARAEALASLEHWSEVDGRDAIERTFTFDTFVDAWGFMSRAAIHAEKQNHHPEWTNVYNSVHVVLSTHDAGGLTDKDLRLARTMDRLFG